jgi:N-glycosylase/DNA lyase
MTVPPQHRAFAETVAASRLQDPRPTFQRLSDETGVPVDDLMHHALVRWVAAGSEALMAVEPRVLDDLAAARAREDWGAVAGIIDWLRSGT